MNESDWKYDNEQNAQYYTRLIERYGSDVQAMDWGSKESQLLRFSVLAGVGVTDHTSILDVGCGMADFLSWFRSEGIRLDYTGIDITPRMIEFARQRFPGVKFDVTNLLDSSDCDVKSFDIVTASGIFAHRKAYPAAFLRAMIGKMFSLCTRAVAFNSLSSWSPTKDSGEFYADPLETVEFCRTLTPWVVLRHDYHPRDFTIYLYKK